MLKSIPLALVAIIGTAAGVAAAPQAQVITGKPIEWTGDAKDNEANTTWNKAPTYAREADGTLRALGLKSFDGVEEPHVKWVVADNKTQRDDFTNITDEGNGVIKMFLRYRGESEGWWDGDQGTDRSDRQRAEVKGIGPHQKDGETFEYGTTFRTDPDFKAYGRFCHIMQIKATDGDKGAPLVTLSITGNGEGALQYYSGNDGFKTAQTFKWTPGAWQTVRFRLKVSAAGAGTLQLSVNGGPFQGVDHVPMFRPQATDYRPKWGLYRGVVKGMTDDWVEHKDEVVRKTAG
jgi:hypothetical protein